MIFYSEKDVEVHFRKVLEDATGEHFKTLRKVKNSKGRHWETDGVIEWQTPSKTPVRVLLEAKFGADFKKATSRSSVLAQALFYCKRFEEQGDDLPNVIFIGDEEYCFAVPMSSLKSFLEAEVDWSRAPSNPDPSLEVNVDTHLESTLGVDGEHLKQLCEGLASACLQKVKPSPQNISAMYQYWVDQIFLEGHSYTPVEMTDIFFGCVFYSEIDEHYVQEHRVKKNTIMMSGKEYNINVSAMRGFFQRRERGLSKKDVDELVSMRDRIIEDDTRRRQGAFYTPTLWVAEAHKEMEKELGEDWRDECVVWDCCSGTGNITRDYDFQNLILSTAEKPDVDVIKRECYNEGAFVFQYDFLNPEDESPFFTGDSDNVLPLKVKKMLKKAAEEDKRIVFLINPPYAEDGVAGAKGNTRKGVASNTLVNSEMPKLGRANRQLYAQFLYQCEKVSRDYGFDKKTIGIFCPSIFMSSGSFSKFREWWYAKYSYKSGFLFQASHFADVKGSWGISFTLWSEGNTALESNLPLLLKDTCQAEKVSVIGDKNLYSPSASSASSWVSALSPASSNIDTPKFSSGLKVKESVSNDKGIDQDALGVMCNMGNSLMKSATDVYFISGKPSHKGCCNFPLVEGEGWRRAISLFSARKLVSSNWVNQKDEYLIPDVSKEGYEDWVDDCHVYALLHSSNNIVSMRSLDYKSKKWDIYNHFFWMSRAEAMELYGESKEAKSLYRDARNNPISYNKSSGQVKEWRRSGDPYFSHILPKLTLSSLSREILSDLQKLFIETIPYRSQITHEKGLDLHLGSWDAGIYQLNKIWKQLPILNKKWEALKVKHRQLGKNLEHGVYTFGFLKK